MDQTVSPRILKLLNKEVSHQMAFFFNQSFSSGIFCLILKKSKIIPVYKYVQG